MNKIEQVFIDKTYIQLVYGQQNQIVSKEGNEE